MLQREFYNIIASEESAVNFCRNNGLLRNIVNCVRCGALMRQVIRHKILRDGTRRDYVQA